MQGVRQYSGALIFPVSDAELKAQYSNAKLKEEIAEVIKLKEELQNLIKEAKKG